MVQSDLARQFSDYIEEFTALGLDQFRKAYCHAVLVLGAGSEAGPDTEFETAAISHEALAALRQAATSSSIPPADILCPGSVVTVVKRGGSPYPDRIGVGRARNVDVWLPLPGISKYHGYFVRLDDGAYAVADAGSRNGIFVAAERIAIRTPVRVADGAYIAFGPHRFMFFGPDVFCRVVARRAASDGLDL